jgi:hypothetical protein
VHQSIQLMCLKGKRGENTDSIQVMNATASLLPVQVAPWAQGQAAAECGLQLQGVGALAAGAT